MPRRSVADEAQALDPRALLAEINRKFGPGAVIMGSDPSLEITRIPTGILALDWRLGGGLARRRHIEIYGSYNVGKTAIVYRTFSSAQALGGNVCMVDAEGTFDPRFATDLGVDVSQLALHEQESGNRCFDFMETILRSGIYDVVALDSIAALLPKSELESDMESGTMGTQQAKLMSQALRKLTVANKRSVIIYINQTREAVGVTFGKRTITSGGKAMGYYAGTRLELVRTENIKRNAKVIDPAKGDERTAEVVKGHRILVRVEKDKTGGTNPHSETTLVFDYGLGNFDAIEDLIYLGRQSKLIKKNSTHWWVEGYEDEKQAGRARFKKFLRRNVAIAEELEESIREWMSEEVVSEGDGD